MRARLVVVMAMAVPLSGLVWADEAVPEMQVTPAWGVSGTSKLNLHAFEFVPIHSGTTYDFSNWMKYVTGGYAALAAGVHLPAGAKVTTYAIWGCDDSAASDFHLVFWRCPRDVLYACEPAVPTVFSSGTGCSVWYSGSLSLTIDNLYSTYFLEFNPTVATIDHRFRQVELYYQLQVSPAPGTATFADVPTSHPFFQYVEALAASGITAGCGGGNYCPNDALTRGQMAVFLSKALGLHWPY
ncbi:MAG: S-layer homology domain-containing protein [Acidobacteriota bacterium]